MQIPRFSIPQDHRALALAGVALALLWWVAYSSVQGVADWLTFGLLGLSHESAIGQSLSFFLYDVPKILLLLAGMIFVITLLQSFIDTQRVRAIVEKRGEGIGNLMAAMFGALTPFCSCSSVPLFIGFVQAGVPLGVTFSFLITSPIMNEVAFVMLLGLFGWQVALLYLVAGVSIGVLAGLILGRLRLERYVEPFVYATKARPTALTSASLEASMSWPERVELAIDATRDILRRVWLFVVIGIAIGALIHGFVPQDALVGLMGESAWWSVPLAVLVGIPLYSNASGIIPIISAMLGKGAALGTALAFMMSVVALSLPELIILRKVLQPRLIAVFVGVVGVSIMLIGFIFNALI
jgi:uncharacterized membrane protein YraQ (UPF0718 family)